MDNSLMFSSKNHEWETPRYIVSAAEKLIRKKFTLDACAANQKMAKAPKFFTPEDDALVRNWTGNVWMNPPYGRKIHIWIDKALEEVRNNHARVVCCLLPARTDTQYFHKLCTKGDIYLIEGRITFLVNGVAGDGAPFPSMLVVFTRELLWIRAPIIQPWSIPDGQ